MFSTCLHCTKDLGKNEIVETLPIGRRLAFDAAQGRLWVVCRHCAKWNLVPFDTRLESIDACERLYRDTKTRYATDNIGLARVKEGLELVRIGEPLRPEFASWRYGDSFGKRRRRNLIIGGATLVGGLAVISGAGALGLGFGMAPHVFMLYQSLIEQARPVVRVPRHEGAPIELSTQLVPELRVIKHPGAGWAVRTKVLQPGYIYRKLRRVDARDQIFTGDEAERLLVGALARQNAYQGSGKQLRSAVELVEQRGTLHDLIIGGGMPTREGNGMRKLTNLPASWRLAVEMALHEGREREALAGELKLLEWEWREADRLAKISDSLALPPDVTDDLAIRKADP
jgi:hypothetical protein